MTSAILNNKSYNLNSFEQIRIFKKVFSDCGSAILVLSELDPWPNPLGIVLDIAIKNVLSALFKSLKPHSWMKTYNFKNQNNCRCVGILIRCEFEICLS